MKNFNLPSTTVPLKDINTSSVTDAIKDFISDEGNLSLLYAPSGYICQFYFSELDHDNNEGILEIEVIDI